MATLARLLPSPSLTVALAALVLAAAGVGVASIPDRGGVVRACYGKTTGILRVIDPARPGLAGRCGSRERRLSWNRRGLRGLRGLPGAKGTNGTNGTNGLDGAAGAAGATNVVIRFATFTSDSSGNSSHESVACQAGERAVGGGIGWTQSPGSGDAVRYSGPEDSSGNTFPAQGATPTGWAGEIHTSDGAGKTGRVYVICAAP